MSKYAFYLLVNDPTPVVEWLAAHAPATTCPAMRDEDGWRVCVNLYSAPQAIPSFLARFAGQVRHYPVSVRVNKRFQGALVGCAMGDALGFMVEKRPPEVCAALADGGWRDGSVLTMTREHHGYAPVPFGQYSDDTQFSRELMASLSACRGWNGDDYAARISALFSEGRVVGAGRASRAAAVRLAAGTPWREAGEPPPAAGNGAAMRAAPIGLFWRHNLATVARVAREQSIITHADPRSGDAAVLVALAAALAATDPTPTGERLAIRLVAACARHGGLGSEVTEAVTLVAKLLADGVDRAEDAAQRIATLDLVADPAWRWISPYAVTTAAYAVWCFLANLGKWEGAALDALRGGGDVDTVAAIAGALAGARLGVAAIPKRYLGTLHDGGTWPVPSLAALAHTCAAKSPRARRRSAGRN